jgi:hypothetical protein
MHMHVVQHIPALLRVDAGLSSAVAPRARHLTIAADLAHCTAITGCPQVVLSSVITLKSKQQDAS